uniref:Gustatory receptor n=1 Tax=Tetranychus urticae TaxID=32264 RepID=T1KJF2_TETUR
MPSINMQQCFVRNEQLKHYPKVSIDSIPSKFQLIISSTSNIYGKCLSVFIMFLLNLVHCHALLYISLDSIFSIEIGKLVSLLLRNWMFIIFYLNYNQNLCKQIDDHWNGLQIDYDYETRKYFSTQKAIYRWLTYILYILPYMMRYCYSFYMDNDDNKSNLSSAVDFKQNIILYFLLTICAPITFFVHFCRSCILSDLAMLAQTAVQFNLVTLKKLLKESRKDEKSLNINAIKNIRHKYLLSCRLVDKLNEIMSPSSFLLFIYFLANACHLSYSLLYTEQNQSDKWYNIILTSSLLITNLVYTHAMIKIHEKSKESLAIVYRLSLKTNSMRLLNEISLFLKHKEIGFSFGGIFMLTTSSLSTLYSIFITIILALPSFVS